MFAAKPKIVKRTKNAEAAEYSCAFAVLPIVLRRPMLERITLVFIPGKKNWTLANTRRWPFPSGPKAAEEGRGPAFLLDERELYAGSAPSVANDGKTWPCIHPLIALFSAAAIPIADKTAPKMRLAANVKGNEGDMGFTGGIAG